MEWCKSWYFKKLKMFKPRVTGFEYQRLPHKPCITCSLPLNSSPFHFLLLMLRKVFKPGHLDLCSHIHTGAPHQEWSNIQGAGHLEITSNLLVLFKSHR